MKKTAYLRVFDQTNGIETLLKRRQPELTPLPEPVKAALRKVFGRDLTPGDAVAEIIHRVRLDGDKALKELTLAFDGNIPESLIVSQKDIQASYDKIDQKLVEALRFAAQRIRRFHEKSAPRSWLEYEKGGALGQIFRPLHRVGLYAPKGTSGYPSSLLMSAIPARVAGVEQIVLATPPQADGLPSPVTLVAADIAGVNLVCAIGGAQAIAALAFGTETIPKVDKILGPGNLFVALAKRQVSGEVAIDQVAGPTETLVIADKTANPRAIAADLLAQAEHDPLASALLITTAPEILESVEEAIAASLPHIPRREIIEASLANTGGALVVSSLKRAVELANDYAPEHLCLLVDKPWDLVPLVRNAGGIFVGEHSLEAIGDYTAGPSHVMPTSGTARFSSPITLWDYLKVTSLFALSKEQVREIGPAAIEIARAEGLIGHARAVELRLEERDD